MIFTTIYTTSVKATRLYSLVNYPEKCNIICANGAQSNVLLHPLVIYMMKTRLDSQVAAKFTVKLYSVVQLCMTHCLPGCACIVSGVWRLQYDLCKWGTIVLLHPHQALFQVQALLTYSTHFGRCTHTPVQ